MYAETLGFEFRGLEFRAVWVFRFTSLVVEGYLPLATRNLGFRARVYGQDSNH